MTRRVKVAIVGAMIAALVWAIAYFLSGLLYVLDTQRDCYERGGEMVRTRHGDLCARLEEL